MGIARGMKFRVSLLIMSIVLLVFTIGCAREQMRKGDQKVTGPMEFWTSSECDLCHRGIVEQYEQSMHSSSFTNPVFHAQYFNKVLPLADSDSGMVKEAAGCIRCHSPVTSLTQEDIIRSEDQVAPGLSGVACDFCHSMTGFRGKDPGGGNYIAKPGEMKGGPLLCQSAWHRKYSGFHRRSEFCAVCHEDENRHGLRVKATYTEWKNSRYARAGIQCQDCHMSEAGLLTGGRPVFESGYAAETSPAKTPYREKLYTHRFPGAHSRQQVTGAINVEVRPRNDVAGPGGVVEIDVLVDNSNTGHKMPSGSADLRLLWIDVTAVVDGRILPIKVTSSHEGGMSFDVNGKGRFDAQMLGTSIPEGCRIYRAVYVDESLKQTFSFYDAVDVVFDNRLDAGEIRKETYRFLVPGDVQNGDVLIQAVLNYLPYSAPFAEQLGLSPAEPVEIGYGHASIRIN